MHHANTIRNLKVLSGKEVRHILETLEDQYGYKDSSGELSLASKAFLMNKDNRIYIVSRDIELMPYDELRIDSIGIYLGELYKESLRLSIEGSQLVGKNSTKGTVEIGYDEMIEWVKGNDIQHDIDTGKNFIIITYKNPTTGKYDYLGCGKYKDSKILNYVSKSRRLVVVND